MTLPSRAPTPVRAPLPEWMPPVSSRTPTPQTTPAGAPVGGAPQPSGPAGTPGFLGRLLTTRRVPGARPRPRFEFRSPEPEPADPTAVVEENRVRLISSAHPVQTGFLLTVGFGLALLVFGILSANTQLLVWIGAALFISLGLDPIVGRIERWGAPRGVGVTKITSGLPFWQDYLAHSIHNNFPYPAIHLAILIEPYLSFILNGKKTIESRFSINRIAPFDKIQTGDIVLLKRAGGPLVGISQVINAWFYQ